ncbi:MAG: 50S ribosome-binding GTPase, partial [Bdellovibrionales bacterium]|nr:50S ribosome-binding GTPase [Bdellovibrionales bacterium]
QAEGVADLISSRTPRGAELALQSIRGCTKNSLENLKKRLVSALAEVEIEIDFSDQGLSRLDYSLWAERLRAWVAEVEKIRKGFLQSGPLRDGFRVAIVGAPNAGKSTLFNQLLGEDRSIVSEWAGTTRDVVRESFLVDGVAFSLSDTAGIRETGEAVEAQGIERSLGEIRSAHAVLLVIDAPAALLRGADEVSRTLSDLESRNFGAKTILVFNKADLLSEEELARGEAVAKSLARPLAVVSAKENKGLESLREQLLLALPPGTEELDAPRIGRTRHCELLGEAAERVGHAVRKVEMGETLPDLLASDLRGALDNLGQITGEVTTDDVLHHIFSEFCIGK